MHAGRPAQKQPAISPRARMVKLAIVGVGGVGGVLAASLATANKCALTLVARGTALRQLRDRGLSVQRHDGHIVSCTPDSFCTVDAASPAPAAAAGPCDFVLLATKAHQCTAAATSVAALCGPNTRVLPMQNGLPWWWWHGFGGDLAGSTVDAVDPGGVLWKTIGPRRVIGCVSFVPGDVDPNYESWRCQWPPSKALLSLGEINDDPTDDSGAVARLASLFEGSELPLGIEPLPAGAVRRRVLNKLCVNASINTLGALARSDCGQVVDNLEEPLRAIAGEVDALARAMGLPPEAEPSSADAIVARYGRQYGLRSSMLQDLEAGRPLERAAIADSLVELGVRLDVGLPTLGLVASLLRALELRNAVVEPSAK